MTLKDTFLMQWSDGVLAGNPIQGQFTVEEDSGSRVEIELSLGVVTDSLFTLAAAEDKCNSFFLMSDQDCVVKVNDSGSPDATLNLKAGVPLIWTPDTVFAWPFAEDITALYITTTVATVVRGRVQLQPS